MLDKIIVALDLESKQEALNLVDILKDHIDFYKIGSVLFTRCGPDLIKELKNKGKKVFLDLKYHDIPNTVSQAVSEAVNLKVDMLTVHTLGGFRMLKEAQIAAQKHNAQHIPLLLGVTVLTSMKESDLYEVGINRKVKSQVKKLALLAYNAGLKGIVCSAKEIDIVKRLSKNALITVVPGIRLKSGDIDDQKRTATPKQALKKGADYLVIGRPITTAKNPLNVVQDILKDI